MTEQISTRCFVCGAQLESEKERNMHICFKCRTYGLLNGCWPEKQFLVVTDRGPADGDSLHIALGNQVKPELLGA